MPILLEECLEGHVVYLSLLLGPSLAGLADLVDHLVPQDADEPGSLRRSAPEILMGPQRCQKGLLDQFLRYVASTDPL